MFEQSISLIPVFGISLLSLLITFILFKVLDSYATAEGESLGQNLKYGGALAGFTIVSGALILIHNSFLPKEPPETLYNLDGKWEIRFLTRTHASGAPILGEATISQKKGSSQIEVAGKTFSTEGNSQVSFWSEIGGIDKNRIIFVYKNSRSNPDEGVATGTLLDTTPSEFVVTFIDIKDGNSESTGEMQFTKDVNTDET